MYLPVPYHVAVVAVYACILTICILALVFGLRARVYVKREKVTALPRGFSPLDVQRICIGKTYPRRLTRALIVHWAQQGYIRVTYIKGCRVKLTCRRIPPEHNGEKAVFFDRGTYVRERDLFKKVFKRQGAEITVNINRPLIRRKEAKAINDSYAVREDEGVYSSKHYKLKVLTFILSVAPFFICGIYLTAASAYPAIIFSFMMFMGMFVFRFLHEIPFWFRLLWSTGWVAPAIILTIVSFNSVFDPWFLGYNAVGALFIGSFILVRFVDYREKNNLSEYSDLVNFKKYLLFSRAKNLKDIDYYAVLPYLYAFNIKFLVKHKFEEKSLPSWFVCEGKRGSLL